MHKIFFFRIRNKNIHLLKLIGAFVLFAALLMFFRSGALMFESWTSLKEYSDCIGVSSNQLEFDSCRTTLFNNTGIFPSVQQSALSARQIWAAVLKPIAELFFWAAIFVIGIILYKAGRIIIPVEEFEGRAARRRKRK